MIDPTRTRWRARFLVAGSVAALTLIALAAKPPGAEARVWLSVGGPFPAYYYGPGPYYGYAPPYYYAPPGYYPPPPDGYNPPAESAASTYAPPPAASAYTPQPASVTPAEPTSNYVTAWVPRVTYTNKPAFTNSAGQTCREYKTTDTTNAHPVDVLGTACKQADGQWRVVN